MNCKLSVIVPFYKEIDLIDRAISSVCSQKFSQNIEVEVIVGNDSDLDSSSIRAVLSEEANKITRIVKNNGEMVWVLRAIQL